MARQKGIIKLKGTVGGITFYKTQDGHLAREKGGIEASRIKSDPAFQRTRENGSEFGRAGTAGKVLRTSIRSLLLNSADNRMVSRLTQAMIKVIQADATSIRGERNVIDGEAELLEGFEFNIRGKLCTSMYAPFTTSIDRVSGQIQVVIPPFNPANMIAAPGGTTHFKIISAGIEVDFIAETYVTADSASTILPWAGSSTVALTQTNTVTPASTKPLFLILGIEFYQEVNGTMYPLKNGAFNPLAIAKVSGL
jgi:hypothetical protein